jgi:hypothetical protein
MLVEELMIAKSQGYNGDSDMPAHSLNLSWNFALAAMIAIGANGCASIGQNTQYALKRNIDTPTKSYSLTDVYDVRGETKPVREGSPLNIIVNRVHIEDNSEDIYEIMDEGEIGVVLSIDDGSEDGGKDVLVSYDHGIEDKVDLPISDLLAYSTTNYRNQPIRVTLTVFEFDQKENDMVRGIMQTAATSAAAAIPAYAPAASLASQLGSYLLTFNTDDIITKFTFELYPWPAGDPDSPSKHFGVPRLKYGHFVVLNSDVDTAEKVIEKNLYVDWKMRIKNKNADERLPLNYVTLTVDPSTALADATQIINRADMFAREAAGLVKTGKVGITTPSDLSDRVLSLGSSIRLFGATREFSNRKQAPEALDILWNAYSAKDAKGNDALNDNDKITLKDQIRRKLPHALLLNDNCKDPTSNECRRLFFDNASKYAYDSCAERYFDPSTDQNGSSCTVQDKETTKTN